MPTALRDATTVSDPRLDRLIHFDPRSRNFSIRALPGLPAGGPYTRLWSLPYGEPVLDQGSEGACVGFGITNELRFRPEAVRHLNAAFAREKIYWEAQRTDDWPGGSYPGANPVYEGTSVLAGIKVAAALGYITEYRWAFGEADLAIAISRVGPAVLGLPWYTGMFDPDRAGYLHPTGQVEGGHCVACVGLNMRTGYYTIYNSWGPDWGRNGRARINRADMAALLAQDGEACIITGRADPYR